MARKKKNDFWDDVDEVEVSAGNSGSDYTANTTDDEEWSAVKSLPLKVIVRFLLMVACLVALASAYIAYEYVGDRYAGGSYSTDFFNSGSFAKEYNKSMDQLMQFVQAMEADPSVTQAGNEELLSTLIENYMGKDTNFYFMILDKDNSVIAYSGEDWQQTKLLIEGSTHYVVVSNTDGETTVKSIIPGKLLDKDAWTKTLSETSNTYLIYTAVGNELTQEDAYYKTNQAFEKMEDYFNIARFVGIIAAVIFALCLIFSIMSTGMKRGHEGVCLSWFDKIFTEIALIIMAAVTVGLVFAIRKLLSMDGDMYRYGAGGLVVVTYIWIIRSYFSIVRRIKAGRLLRNSVIGTIIGGVAGAIGKLPSPLNVIVGAVLLIAINGGLVAGVIFLRQYTVKGIPIMFIVAPVVFLIELLALLVHGSGDDEEAEEGEAEDGAPVSEAASDSTESEPGDAKGLQEVQQPEETAAGEDVQLDWEALDLGKAIEDAERTHAQQMQHGSSEVSDNVIKADAGLGQKTEILSAEAVEKAIRASGLTMEDDSLQVTPEETSAEEVSTDTKVNGAVDSSAVENAIMNNDRVVEETVVNVVRRNPVESVPDDGHVNFVQLNKDVRKEFRAALKRKGISVTVRAPEKPIIIDIDRNSLHIIISDIFSQIEKLSAHDVRNYVEVYQQGGKVVYIVRIAVADEAKADAERAVAGDNSFEAARKIIEANDGKFIVTMDGDVLKVGMLIDAAQ